jgi:hypothetical protein
LAQCLARSPINTRLEALEKNLLSVRGEAERTAKQLQIERGDRSDADREERGQRIRALLEIQSQLNQLAAGGLHVEWIGVFWLVVGLILSTVSPEIAYGLDWLHRLFD